MKQSLAIVIFWAVLMNVQLLPLYLCDSLKCSEEDIEAGNEFSRKNNILGTTCQSLQKFCAKDESQRTMPTDDVKKWPQNPCYQGFMKGCMNWSYRDEIDVSLFEWCFEARYHGAPGCDWPTATDYIFTITIKKCSDAAFKYCSG